MELLGIPPGARAVISRDPGGIERSPAIGITFRGGEEEREMNGQRSRSAMPTLPSTWCALAILLAGCAAASPTSGPISDPPNPAQSPAPIATSTLASPAAPAIASSSPTPTATASGDPSDRVTEELFMAIGNPDTGSTSPAWTDFTDALASADATRIRATAQVVLDHLANARTALSQVPPAMGSSDAVFSPPAPPWDWATEWDAMLAAIGEGVGAMRDGTLAGDPAAVTAGSIRMNNGLLDHFYPVRSVTMSDGPVVSVSGLRMIYRPEMAFDRRLYTIWSAGNHPLPGWIQIDFGTARTISAVRLLTYQDQAGETEHRVTGWTAAGTEVPLAQFHGSTHDEQWLTQTLASPVPDIRYVRITTLSSPSMVAWREIELLSPGQSLPPLLAAPTPPAPTPPVSTPTPGPVVEDRLPDGRIVRASSAYPNAPPAGAFDGVLDTGWGSGTFPVAWIEIDLGKNVALGSLRLLPAQSPSPASTVHRVYGRLDGTTAEVLLHEFRGITEDRLWISTALDPAKPVRYLRIETVTSPSWVGWFEIEIIPAP